jgi:hypothetical protein
MDAVVEGEGESLEMRVARLEERLALLGGGSGFAAMSSEPAILQAAYHSMEDIRAAASCTFRPWRIRIGQQWFDVNHDFSGVTSVLAHWVHADDAIRGARLLASLYRTPLTHDESSPRVPFGCACSATCSPGPCRRPPP